MRSQEINPELTALSDPDRRKFLNSTAVLGLAGAGLSMGLAACKRTPGPAGADGQADAPAGADEVAFGTYEVPLGQLDTYHKSVQ